MQDYTKLEIWKLSKDLCLEVYRLTESFPDTEKFGLTSQLRRCSVSIPSNSAEGAARNYDKEFLHIALGSIFELETQLSISVELNFYSKEDYIRIIELLDKTKRKLINFISIIKKKT